MDLRPSLLTLRRLLQRFHGLQQLRQRQRLLLARVNATVLTSGGSCRDTLCGARGVYPPACLIRRGSCTPQEYPRHVPQDVVPGARLQPHPPLGIRQTDPPLGIRQTDPGLHLKLHGRDLAAQVRHLPRVLLVLP